jgi:hypothetical protein
VPHGENQAGPHGHGEEYEINTFVAAIRWQHGLEIPDQGAILGHKRDKVFVLFCHAVRGKPVPTPCGALMV